MQGHGPQASSALLASALRSSLWAVVLAHPWLLRLANRRPWNVQPEHGADGRKYPALLPSLPELFASALPLASAGMQISRQRPVLAAADPSFRAGKGTVVPLLMLAA